MNINEICQEVLKEAPWLEQKRNEIEIQKIVYLPVTEIAKRIEKIEQETLATNYQIVEDYENSEIVKQILNELTLAKQHRDSYLVPLMKVEEKLNQLMAITGAEEKALAINTQFQTDAIKTISKALSNLNTINEETKSSINLDTSLENISKVLDTIRKHKKITEEYKKPVQIPEIKTEPEEPTKEQLEITRKIAEEQGVL